MILTCPSTTSKRQLRPARSRRSSKLTDIDLKKFRVVPPLHIRVKSDEFTLADLERELNILQPHYRPDDLEGAVANLLEKKRAHILAYVPEKAGGN